MVITAIFLTACAPAKGADQSLIDRARDAEVTGDYKTCSADTTEVLAYDAADADALATRAECEVLATDVMDAVTDADRAFNVTHGTGLNAILARGFVALRIGRKSEGVSFLMPLIRDPSLGAGEPVCILAVTDMVDAGQYDAAITASRILEARFPTSWRVEEQAGRAYTGAGRADDALQAFAVALDNTGSPLFRAEIYSNRAHLYALQRDLPSARDDMDRVLLLDQVDYSYFEQRALVEDAMADYSACSTDLAVAISLAKVRPHLPADVIGRLYFEGGLAFIHASEDTRAVADLRAALRYLGGDPTTTSQVTTLLSMTGAG